MDQRLANQRKHETVMHHLNSRSALGHTNCRKSHARKETTSGQESPKHVRMRNTCAMAKIRAVMTFVTAQAAKQKLTADLWKHQFSD